MQEEKEYTVNELAILSGVSVRTLHYYDEIGLLQPKRKENKYRRYAAQEVDRLQQILLYRESGMSLSVIKEVLDDPSFSIEQALRDHLQGLRKQRKRLDEMIASVEKTVACKKGLLAMKDTERFESLKKDLIEKNEQRYGSEIREKYGTNAMEASNAKIKGWSKEEYERSRTLESEIKTFLHQGMEKNDPASEEAQKACDLHRQWLCLFWEKGTYSKEAHRGMGEMYATDERFKVYYDAEKPGTAGFFRKALEIYTRKA